MSAVKIKSLTLGYEPTTSWIAAYVHSKIWRQVKPILHTVAVESLPSTVPRLMLPTVKVFEYNQFQNLYSQSQETAAITPMSDLWHMLRHVPDIEDLNVTYSSLSIPEEDFRSGIETRITLCNLSSLTVGHIDAEYARVLMGSINAPRLDKLVLRCIPIWYHQDVWTVPTTWISRLRTLVLEGFRILEGNPMISLTRLLVATKGLKTLSIKTPATDNTNRVAVQHLFNALSNPSPAGEWLCPSMAEFTLGHCNLVTGTELLSFVRNREQTSTVSDIRVLSILNCATLDLDTLDELECLVPTVTYVAPQPLQPPRM